MILKKHNSILSITKQIGLYSNYEVGQSWTLRPGGSLEETRRFRLVNENDTMMIDFYLSF